MFPARPRSLRKVAYASACRVSPESTSLTRRNLRSGGRLQEYGCLTLRREESRRGTLKRTLHPQTHGGIAVEDVIARVVVLDPQVVRRLRRGHSMTRDLLRDRIAEHVPASVELIRRVAGARAFHQPGENVLNFATAIDAVARLEGIAPHAIDVREHGETALREDRLRQARDHRL